MPSYGYSFTTVKQTPKLPGTTGGAHADNDDRRVALRSPTNSTGNGGSSRARSTSPKHRPTSMETDFNFRYVLQETDKALLLYQACLYMSYAFSEVCTTDSFYPYHQLLVQTSKSHPLFYSSSWSYLTSCSHRFLIQSPKRSSTHYETNPQFFGIRQNSEQDGALHCPGR